MQHSLHDFAYLDFHQSTLPSTNKFGFVKLLSVDIRFKPVSQHLCFFNSITSVFATFNAILFTFNQKESSCKSLLSFLLLFNGILYIQYRCVISKVKS